MRGGEGEGAVGTVTFVLCCVCVCVCVCVTVLPHNYVMQCVCGEVKTSGMSGG